MTGLPKPLLLSQGLEIQRTRTTHKYIRPEDARIATDKFIDRERANQILASVQAAREKRRWGIGATVHSPKPNI